MALGIFEKLTDSLASQKKWEKRKIRAEEGRKIGVNLKQGTKVEG